MKENKSYIISLREGAVSEDVVGELISNKYYLHEENLPVIIYRNRKQIEEIETSVRPAFRMHGFIILNFNPNDENIICDKVKRLLNTDEFIRKILTKNEVIAEEKITYKKIDHIIKILNINLDIKLNQENIFKISEIKVMPKEEQMTLNIPSVGIFVSSPKDVSVEREKTKDIIDEIKKGEQFSKKLDIQCETFNWEDSSGKKKTCSLQSEINNSNYDYNIYVIILWKDFLLKGDEVDSKIEEEINALLKNYKNKEPSKFWLVFYFKASALPQLPQSEIEHAYRQHKKIDQVKSEAQRIGICTTYNDEGEFERKFKKEIEDLLNKIEKLPRLKQVQQDIQGRMNAFYTKYSISVREEIKKYKNKDTFKSYIELQALDSDGKLLGNLTHAVDEAVESGKPIAIIGEYGTGKTTFTRYYEYKKKLEWLENPDKSRLVVFIEMKKYSKKKYNMSMAKWILDYIKREMAFKMQSRELQEHLKEDRLLLIFDGLDEVANIAGKDAINKTIRRIKRISHRGSPVIITSRKAFLEAEVDQKNLKEFVRIYIDKLSDQQITNCVRFKIPGNWRDFIDKKDELDDSVAELVHRPMFLCLMIEAYKRGHLKKILNPADLYEVLVDDWMSEEIKEKSLKLKKGEMKRIIQELSLKMFFDNQFLYDHEEFAKTIQAILDEIYNTLSQNLNYENVLNEMTNVSFLVRDKVNKNTQQNLTFGFSHRSYVEFFTAQKMALELKERNTKNFSERILYEEIFEFLSWIMTEASGKDEDLTYILGDPQFPFKARVNAIPPLRKQRNRKAIKPLLDAHTDIESGNALLQFVCGYTLAIFQEEFPEEFDLQETIDRLDETYKKENNSLNRLRTALLLTKGEYENEKYKELQPDYKFASSDLDEILEPSGTIEAYDKILKKNLEHPFVLEESIRILTLYVMSHVEAEDFKSALLRYIFDFGCEHISERLRRISLWSIDKLGLLEPEIQTKETSKIKTKAGRIVVRHRMKDEHSSVKEIAKKIISKYEMFIPTHLRDDQ
jgi:hypothetical protein